MHAADANNVAGMHRSRVAQASFSTALRSHLLLNIIATGFADCSYARF
jgi:hypothetical protein